MSPNTALKMALVTGAMCCIRELGLIFGASVKLPTAWTVYKDFAHIWVGFLLAGWVFTPHPSAERRFCRNMFTMLLVTEIACFVVEKMTP